MISSCCASTARTAADHDHRGGKCRRQRHDDRGRGDRFELHAVASDVGRERVGPVGLCAVDFAYEYDPDFFDAASQRGRKQLDLDRGADVNASRTLTNDVAAASAFIDVVKTVSSGQL